MSWKVNRVAYKLDKTSILHTKLTTFMKNSNNKTKSFSSIPLCLSQYY